MHSVAALDASLGMRAVLCLFEGVATGAADGYARIAGRPAATLLHLGPGLANGLANLHNARRARSPVVNIVGDHATYHQKLDAPLQSNIEALADWLEWTVHRPASTAELGNTVDATIAAARGGHIATLILPADLLWGESNTDAPPPRTAPPHSLAYHAQDIYALEGQEHQSRDCGKIEHLGQGGRSAPVPRIGSRRTAENAWGASGPAARRACDHCGRPPRGGSVSAATGAKAFVETFPARLARGRGVPDIPRLGYFAEQHRNS